MTEQEQTYLKEIVISLSIELQEKKELLKASEENAAQRWEWYSEKDVELKALQAAQKITLSSFETQSNLNRVNHAENLISQLPKDHDGRNTWLLNYGIRNEAKSLRDNKNLEFIEATQSCETVK